MSVSQMVNQSLTKHAQHGAEKRQKERNRDPQPTTDNAKGEGETTRQTSNQTSARTQTPYRQTSQARAQQKATEDGQEDRRTEQPSTKAGENREGEEGYKLTPGSTEVHT